MSESAYRFRPLPHLLVPVVLAVFGVMAEYTGLDHWLIQPFYDASTQTWPYEKLWITAGLLHIGGKYFIEFIALLLLGGWVASFFYKPFARRRWGFAYALLGALVGIGIVALLKDNTHIYSPIKLIQYGGEQPYIRLFDPVPPGAPIGHAFPAGHASGAFGLVSIYFLLAAYGSRWRYPALAFCLSLGFLYGFVQQMRGQHFFSHDLFALAVCWTAALGMLYLMRIPRRARAAGHP